MSSRVAVVVGIVCAALFGVAPNVCAKDGAKPPAYTVESMFPKEAPEGWTVKEDESNTVAGLNEKALMALAKASGTDVDDVFVVERLFTKGSESAKVALIDVDADPAALRTALDTEAAAKGWSVLALGSPMRLMVVGGPEGARNAAHDVMKEHVIHYLCEIAYKRLHVPRKTEAVRAAAEKFLSAARSMAPKAGIAYAIEGISMHDEGKSIEGLARRARAQLKMLEKADESPGKAEVVKTLTEHAEKAEASAKDLLNNSIPLLTKGLKSTNYPPKGLNSFRTGAKLGSLILVLKKNDSIDLAIEALTKAANAEAHSPATRFVFGNRYDLACAYARAKKNDEALQWLQRAFEIAETSLSKQDLHGNYTHWGKDPDLDGLRDLPKFKELMTKYKPKGYKPPEEKKDEDKKKDEEEGKDAPEQSVGPFWL